MKEEHCQDFNKLNKHCGRYELLKIRLKSNVNWNQIIKFFVSDIIKTGGI